MTTQYGRVLLMIRMIGYLDPGSGATITQLLLAGTVGIGVIVKLKWHSVRSFFDRSSSSTEDSLTAIVTPPAAAQDEEPVG
jgi:hypothetical protein